MKKLILIALTLSLMACSNDDEKDCNCDRITNVTHFSLPNGTTFGGYATVNDCTGLRRSYSWTNNKPREGDCKK